MYHTKAPPISYETDFSHVTNSFNSFQPEFCMSRNLPLLLKCGKQVFFLLLLFPLFIKRLTSFFCVEKSLKITCLTTSAAAPR